MSEYITPAEATRIRVHHEGGGAWAIDAADDAGRYTDSNWNRDGAEDKRLTRERAMELVPEFVAHLGLPAGLPAGLPVEVRECDPPRIVEVIASPRFYVERSGGGIRPAAPARIVCYDEGDGEWTIEAQDEAGAAIRDERGRYVAVWHDEEALDDFQPMTRDAAVAAAVALAGEIGHPALPVLVSDGGTMTQAAGGHR